MAINSFDIISCNKKISIPECSTNISKKGKLLRQSKNVNSGINCSVPSKSSQLIIKNYKSPYLVGDKTQPTSQNVDKKEIQKMKTDIVSSFPLAVNVYKANSNEYKSIKCIRKVKKSVLTLPNEQSIMPERCTVSDMNDTEIFDNDSRKIRLTKRIPCQSNKKFRSRNTGFEFRDTGARFCSDLKIDVDSSSTDMTRHYDGDRKRVLHRFKSRKSQVDNQFNGHNVWKVLRNMNRFRFMPSPPVSDVTIITPRKKKAPKRCKKKNKRFMGTCHTEEFAYISSIEVDSKSARSFSQSSSFDRITVIDKQDDFGNLDVNIAETLVKSRNSTRNLNVKNCNHAKNITPNKIVPTLNNKLYKFKDTQMKCINNIATDMRNETHFESTNHTGNVIVSKDKKIDNFYGLHDNFIYSGNSGSSKAACGNCKGNANSSKLSSDESSQHMAGITNIKLTEDQDILLANKTKPQKRKQRLFTAIPNTTIIPKLTQTEIKRRLRSIKYPLVILDKDQVSSTIQVVDFDDHPQFAGLDKHIWPYMLEWNSDFSNTDKSYKIENNIPKTKCYTVQSRHNNKNLGKNIKIFTNNNDIKANRNRDGNSLTNNTIPVDQTVSEIEQKAMHYIKDNVLKQSSKQLPTTNLYEITHQVGGGDVKDLKSKNLRSKNHIAGSLNSIRSPIIKESSNMQHMGTIKPLLMKNKLSSVNTSKITRTNLIDSITMNIKNGIYYNEAEKYTKNKRVNTSKETSIQRTVSLKDILEIQTDQVEYTRSSTSTEISTKYHNLLKAIPGFECTVPDLEIKTLNLNKIEVKYCLSNILVQFDVIILPLNPNTNIKNFKRPITFIPLEGTDGEDKILKCKTSILNSILPAELCGILPEMAKDLITSEVKNLPLLPVNEATSHFSTISELSLFRNTEYEIYRVNTPVHLEPFLDALLFKPIKINFKQSTNEFKWTGEITSFNLLPAPMINKLSISCNLVSTEVFYPNEIKVTKSFKMQGIEELRNQKQTFCTTLQTYNLKDWRAAITFKPYNFYDMISKIWKCNNYSNIFVAPTISLVTFDIGANRLIVNIIMNKDHQEEVLVGLNNLKTDTINGNFSYTLSNKIEYSGAKITNTNKINVAKKASFGQIMRSTIKHKRKGYMKLYKKFKSTTHIPREKQSPSLNKIENLDDFFQLLGWTKSFSNVIDVHASRKIMSSIAEMKNWIQEINSHQALLILLLVNKKETPNLIRFRPVLLQGIAVNRITKVSELDTEIEVIERENINSFLKFEGISYLPASNENKDNLLEELNWIAKTTASDYQKPFDESSEKLLKSLLERRKKLNPSYLRLMARYVGLGLLKFPLLRK